ncbi:MAG TPA: glycosyltransferase family 61 protein [Vicinamibacterales bacterium]|nr:glycosyltransferase family 61 protein [Vicinamibacterales bacterium]
MSEPETRQAVVDTARLAEAIAEVRGDAREAADHITAVETDIAVLRGHTDTLLDADRRALADRADLARVGGARLLSDSVVLDGTAAERLRIRRLRPGEAVERPFAASRGVTCCVTGAADVRALWGRLLAREASSIDDCLRGNPATILDIPDASVSKDALSTLHVALRGERGGPRPLGDVAVPRFAHAVAPRKLRNFAHWLLDCLPQAAALATVAPGARMLLPCPLNDMQRTTLELAGVAPAQMTEWDGGAVCAKRLLIFESDGRMGGGRPLSPLLAMRRRVAGDIRPGSRRIYVSRRDARSKRRWAVNEPAIEALFASHGFEIVCPTSHTLADLVRIFGEASIVAGLNGAGLAHIFFSPPGTHVAVLLTDSLVRWHADSGGARSLWASEHHARAGELAALGDSPRFYTHVAAAFGQPCHSFLGADDVPLDDLRRFLAEVMSRVVAQ